MAQQRNHVLVWVLSLCSLVMMMVVVGGVTRLTGSGLSIVEWKPLMGAIPPLSHGDWLDVFGKYQASPQYQLVNRGMTLPEFQWIFFWEYFHRLLGRIMGVVFLIPWLWFWMKGYYDRRWAGRFLLGFLLGGLQGLMGWLMVASGLVNQPQVSHFRLAAHLLLAFFILAYFWRMGWLFHREHTKDSRIVFAEIDEGQRNIFLSLKRWLNGVLLLLVLQILFGALVAGLRAGFMYNTFPDMEGQFFPQGAWLFSPGWKNFFENPLMIQWVHRMLGWTILLAGLGLFIRYRSTLTFFVKRSLTVLALVFATQFLLGVFTLILKVPLPLAVLHQVGACLVLLYLLWLRWELQVTAQR